MTDKGKQPLFDPRRICLASASPRRKEALEGLGFLPVIVPVDVDETLNREEGPDRAVVRLSLLKCADAARRSRWLRDEFATGHQNPFVIAADTVVVIRSEQLGKPFDANEAVVMLRKLSGRTHTVYSGVTVLDRRTNLHDSVAIKTRVTFSKLSEQTIARYISTGEPLDKAGAYGIQGLAGALVTQIVGSYSNVVGLPLSDTIDLLKKMGAISAFPFAAQDFP
ncbi:MAG: septum formation protein Maf [Deltaproteobacteria bacterium CG2_30_63_29]|nr:MAG: septum formation protein Maf [Deltaproteobacteria bacterium CG2_30_63_29]PJB34703.1 MAG: septum formation protein Maf [Deltaproteobacteria bacterium CG_4_9_14_3_um_filter_63_12]